MVRNPDPKVLRGVAVGLTAGLAATWAMTKFQEAWNQVADSVSKDGDMAGGTPESEDEGQTATVKAAEAVSESVFHHHLTKDEKTTAGAATHMAFGAAAGAVYGALAEVYPTVTAGSGLGYGAAVWGFADNVAVPALGLSKWPTEYPLSTSIYGLSAHLVFGATLELTRKLCRAVI
jgi:hypothetical protein